MTTGTASADDGWFVEFHVQNGLDGAIYGLGVGKQTRSDCRRRICWNT
jgi:hypothetical protein